MAEINSSAVLYIDGPLLVLAGVGRGKSAVGQIWLI